MGTVRSMSDTSGTPTNEARRGSRLLPTLGGFIGLLVLLAVVVAVLAGPGVVGDWLRTLNPFSEKTIDRTGPSVLHSLTNLSEYHAASAHYETVVDIAKDTERLPDWVSGERVLYVGKGDVDAMVDFGELDESRVVVSDDGTSVAVRLPAPTADEPVLDLKNSYVANHDEGLINRFSGSELERDAQLKAVAQMTTAAHSQDMLIGRAKDNTSAMLRGLFGALGYTSIKVTFDEDPT
jgi:hypothetical protein